MERKTSEDIIKSANVRLCRLFSWRNYNGYGFQLSKCTQPPHLINLIESGSPAAVGGLRMYDVVLAVNNRKTSDMKFIDLVNFLVSLRNPHQPLELLVVEQHIYKALKKNNSTIHHSAVHIHTCPKVMPEEYVQFSRNALRTCVVYLKTKETKFGFDIVNGHGDTGVFIQEVSPHSPAFNAGLRKCDRLIELNGQYVEDIPSSVIIEKLHKAAAHRAMKLAVKGTEIVVPDRRNSSDPNQEDTYIVIPTESYENESNRDDLSLSIRSTLSASIEPKRRICSEPAQSNLHQADNYLVFSNGETNVVLEGQYEYCDTDESSLSSLSVKSTPVSPCHNQNPPGNPLFHMAATTEFPLKRDEKPDYLEPSSILLDFNENAPTSSKDEPKSSESQTKCDNEIKNNEIHKGNQRFSDILSEPLIMMLPIEGYDDVPLLSLTNAVENLDKFVRRIERYAWIALERSTQVTDELTIDESAAIQLYTMDGKPGYPSLSMQLNAVLRKEDRDELVPYYPYFKLLLTALWKLKSVSRIVWRGVKGDAREKYPIEKVFVWWGFSSCMDCHDVLLSEKYLGVDGVRTLFHIESTNGKPIQSHSYNKAENEILLLPATQFQVVKHDKFNANVYIIYLKEVSTKYNLLQSPFGSDYSTIPIVTTKANIQNDSDV
ncbi:unnamed protein product [Adineta ricciae]|uniref:NAD(P)(+)--arginine ADP-ribosyltransferase n=1 Tax=Adineta ricciae TaxID=249248 RepID=A0A814UWI2_ADIRI|nr:unnamed protein product [Adineta ricciae]